MSVLEVNNLHKKYKNFHLDDISLTLNEGEILGFIGENGSGKSTTMKAIAGLINYDSGDIKVFNKNINELTFIERNKVSFILDELCFPSNFKIKQLKKLLGGIFPNINVSLLENYLRKFNLNEEKKIKELSKGMKVKLNIAISFSRGAKLFVLDEPTNGLDPVARDEYLDLLLEEVEKNGCSILISSHIISDLERICDKILLIHEGRTILNDYKDNILNNNKIIKINNLDEIKGIQGVICYKSLKNNEYSVLVNKDCELLNKYDSITDLEQLMILLIRGKRL